MRICFVPGGGRAEAALQNEVSELEQLAEFRKQFEQGL